MQGYLFSRPQPADKVIEFFVEHVNEAIDAA
jgi:EAL domain-containing protein (putative c-di-GMP-specific phosphodiesterase class I)